MVPINNWVGHFVVLTYITVLSTASKCSRHESRIAREIISEHFQVHYTDKNVDVPSACPFESSRDMYMANEKHKNKQGYSKWQCEYCGKAFMTERTLDVHFDNRHEDKIFKGSEAICLADYCDFLRCNIVSGTNKPSYWEQALCKETDMKILREKCENIVKTCGPLTLVGTARYDFQRAVKETLCNYLTCEKYWEVPLKEGSAFGLTAYIIAVVILFMALIIYYYIVYTHYYSEHSLLDDSDGLLKMKRQPSYQYSHEPSNYHIRQRYNVDR